MEYKDPELWIDDEEKRRERNCHGEYGTSFGVDWDPDIDQCPKSYLTEDVMHVIGWYMDWRRFGAFPFPGDVLDQPLYVYEGLCLCADIYQQAEHEMRRRAEANNV